MNLEDKEGTVRPVGDEELENASGGLGRKAQFDKLCYRCTACGFENIFRTSPGDCPKCHGRMEVVNIPFE